MELVDLVRLVRRNWLSLVLLTVLGATLGALTAWSRPLSYSSAATTTVVSGAEKSPVDGAYSVTQAIRVTMPAYVAQSTGTGVVDAASRASGLTTQQVANSLITTRDPDSTVILWTMQSSSSDASRQALAAATAQFQLEVAESAPTSDAGRPLIAVRIDREASFGQPSRAIPPILAGGAGALAGLAGALLLGVIRARGDRRITSRDSIELGLSIPVVAELSNDQEDRARAWGYVASYLARLNVTEPVLVVTGRQSFSVADIKMARAALAAPAVGRTPELVAPYAADNPNLATALLRSGAVIMVLADHLDNVGELRPIVNSIVSVSPGPVFAVLDIKRANPLLLHPRRVGHQENLERVADEWAWDSTAEHRQGSV